MRSFFQKSREHNLLEQYESESPGLVEVQRLFKTLYKKGGINDFTSLMMTSALPGEGKSFLIGNLALIADQANRRTVIIDADMRAPVQHRQFHVSQSPGLSDYLSQKAKLKQILRHTKFSNLKLIPSGNRILSSGRPLQDNFHRFQYLLERCRMHFDIVLVDVPPVLPVDDAEIISPLMDGVVLVVMSGKTYREIVDRALELLQQSNCNLLGMVLNDAKGVLPYHYEQVYYQYDGPVWSKKQRSDEATVRVYPAMDKFRQSKRRLHST